MSRIERARADTILPEHLNDFSSEEGAAFPAVSDPTALVSFAIGYDDTLPQLAATGDEFLSEDPDEEIAAALAFAAVDTLRFSPPFVSASPVVPATRKTWSPPRHIAAASIAMSACALLALLLVADVPGWIRSTSDGPPAPSMPASEPPAIAVLQAAPFAPLPAGVAAQAPRPIEAVPSKRATSRQAARALAPRRPAETRVARGRSPLKARHPRHVK